MKQVPNNIKSDFLKNICIKAAKEINDSNVSITNVNNITTATIFASEKDSSKIIHNIYVDVTKNYNKYIEEKLGGQSSDYNCSLLFDDRYEGNRLIINWAY